MPRSVRSRDINIFNFSFLDILACTIGALTFILVMVLLRPPGRVNTAAMEESREQLDEEIKTLTASLAKARQDSAGQEARLKKTREEIPQMHAQLSALKGELEGKRSRNEKLALQVAAIIAERKKKNEDVKEISKRVHASEAEVAGLTQDKPINVRFEIPRWHETNKLPVYFECASGKVNCLSRWKLIKGRDGETEEVPIPDPTPTAIAQINHGKSHFASRTAQMDTNNEYAFFFVRPDGFDSFRIAREILWGREIEVGWTPWSATGPIIRTTGEGEEVGPMGGGGN